MGRKRTQLILNTAQAARIRRLVRVTDAPRAKERLRFALKAATGRHSLEELAGLLGRSRSTIQNWLDKFHAGGLDGLLERDTPPGKVSPLAKGRIQAELRAGLKSGRWHTAAQVAVWLKERHGVERSRKSIYYWLHKPEVRS